MDLVIAPGTSGAHSKFRSDSESGLPADEQIFSRSVALAVRLVRRTFSARQPIAASLNRGMAKRSTQPRRRRRGRSVSARRTVEIGLKTP